MSWRILILIAAVAGGCCGGVTAAFLGPTRSRHYQHPGSSILSTTTSSSSSDLLYQEHEKMLIQRGIVEGELMNQQEQQQALQPPKIKGVGTSGGFGSSGGNSNTKSNKKQQGTAYAQVFRQEGVIRFDNVLTKDLAENLRNYCLQLRKESTQLEQDGMLAPRDRFAEVLLKENRCDLTLPLNRLVVGDALVQLLLESPVAATIEAVLGKNAILYELSCLMSDAGSHRQVMHPDTPCHNNLDDTDDDTPVLMTCFVALQDILPDMGPTTWMPQTHTPEIHAQFNQEGEEKDNLLANRPAVLGILPQGSCGMFDSRLLHCGGANTNPDNITRAVFYVSFQNPAVNHVGNPGSIRRDLIGQWTLKDLQKECKMHQKGKSKVFGSGTSKQ